MSGQLYRGDALSAYPTWPDPDLILSDGAYGLAAFPGDPPSVEGLAEWYLPHLKVWGQRSKSATVLWFWNSELGWATVHPLLEAHGWEYQQAHIWDKGLAHVAGNVNGKTIRRFPIVTEVCVLYSRKLLLPTGKGEQLPVKEWLRHEWARTGLPLSHTNRAAGVKNAATRKYFTKDHLWYLPPTEMILQLAAYATRYGTKVARPYFSITGKPLTGPQWDLLRYRWNHIHGVTNVWRQGALHSKERFKNEGRVLHANQKPLQLLEQILAASSSPGDVCWEPFAGLASATVAAALLGRKGYGAEINPTFYKVAKKRVAAANKQFSTDKK